MQLFKGKYDLHYIRNIDFACDPIYDRKLFNLQADTNIICTLLDFQGIHFSNLSVSIVVYMVIWQFIRIFASFSWVR